MSIPQAYIDEMKALNRELEDIQEDILRTDIDNALLEKEQEIVKEMLANEMSRNVRAKKRLQEMTALAAEEKARSDSLCRISIMLNQGTLSRMVNFAESKLKEAQGANKLTQADIEKQLDAQINSFMRSHPSDLSIYQNELECAEMERTVQKNAESMKALRSDIRAEREMSEAMFRLNVIEIAKLALQYRTLMNELNNPESYRVERANQTRKFMSTHLSRVSSSTVPSTAGGSDSNRQLVSDMASSSQHQENLDTNEDPAAMHTEPSVPAPSTQDRAFGQTSLSRAAIRPRNAVQRVGTEKGTRSKALATPPAQSVVEPNVSDETNTNDEAVSGQSEPGFQDPGAFTKPPDRVNSSQRTRKSKVTFVEFQSSAVGCQVALSQDEAVSCSELNVVATDVESDEISSARGNLPDLFDNIEISPDNEIDGQSNGDGDINMDVDGEFAGDLDDQISNWTSLDVNDMDEGAQSPVSNFSDMFGGTDANHFQVPEGSAQSAGNDEYNFDDDDDFFK